MTALFNYDPPNRSLTKAEVVITVGVFDSFEIEKLCDPYQTSPRAMNSFVIEKLEKPGSKYDGMNKWFQETETFPVDYKVVTTTNWVQDSIRVSLILTFKAEGDALMFRMKWI